MIERKKKICKECEEEDYIFGHGLCRKCYNFSMAKKQRHKKRNTTTKNTHKQESTKTQVPKKLTTAVKAKINKADDLFREIVKKKGAKGVQGNMNNCYTCDIYLPISSLQCGHFQPRGNYSTRWLLENGRPQCKVCNEEKRGNLQEFEKRLEAEMPGVADTLRQLAREPLRLTSAVLDEIIEGLQQILKELEGK